MFTKAIVRTPSKSIVKGISTADLGIPDYSKALEQHKNYIEALKSCGLEVVCLEADEEFPDSTFVEDVALLTRHCAVITNPGAESRKKEVALIKPVIKSYYSIVEAIDSPATLEAGDIMMVGDLFYIGLSERTNQLGAERLISILEKYQLTGSIVNFKEVLHLKTGVSYLENNNLLACGEFLSSPEFKDFNIIEVPQAEAYAANSVWINDYVLTPKGFHTTKRLIESAGYKTIEVDVSEFQKVDGGLSCLSLRF